MSAMKTGSYWCSEEVQRDEQHVDLSRIGCCEIT